MLAGISYTTFPEIDLGPLTLRTFGLMVGLGVVVGAWLAARFIEQATGVDRDDTYALATRMVVAGIIGSRITWVLSHLDEIERPLDVIAIWEGGLQFSGGFVAAIIIGFPTFRKWKRDVRWKSLDGYAYGLTIGLAIGRIGCYSVGEHFGATTSFFLGTTYKGGSTREGLEGTAFETAREFQANGVGTTFHNTSLYEFLYLFALFGLFTFLISFRSKPTRPGTLIGIFCLYYGIARFVTDFARVNDNKVLGLTGAQYLMLLLVPASMWILCKVRPAIEAMDDGSSDDSDDRDAAEDAVLDAAITDAEPVDAVSSSDSGHADDSDDADYPAVDRT